MGSCDMESISISSPAGGDLLTLRGSVGVFSSLNNGGTGWDVISVGVSVSTTTTLDRGVLRLSDSVCSFESNRGGFRPTDFLVEGGDWDGRSGGTVSSAVSTTTTVGWGGLWGRVSASVGDGDWLDTDGWLTVAVVGSCSCDEEGDEGDGFHDEIEELVCKTGLLKC